MAAKAITGGLTAVPLGPVNVFLIDAPDGLVLIDSGVPEKADAILSAVQSIGKQPSDLKHIILTHAHPDHIGSAAALVEATGAETWMHPLDAPIAERGDGFRPMKPAPELLQKLLFALFVRSNATVEPMKVDHLVEDGDTIPLAGGMKVIHVPGHCAGQIALLWQGHGTLFAADSCANLMGLGSPLGYEDEAEGRRSQAKLARLEFHIACFGHGKAMVGNASERFRKKWGHPV